MGGNGGEREKREARLGFVQGPKSDQKKPRDDELKIKTLGCKTKIEIIGMIQGRLQIIE